MILKNIKNMIIKIDFLLILAFGLLITFLSWHYNFFGFKSRIGSYFYHFLMIISSCFFSCIRYKFVYGSDDYKKTIRDHQKKFLSNSSKNYFSGVIVSGDNSVLLIPVILFFFLGSFFFLKAQIYQGFILFLFISIMLALAVIMHFKNRD